MSHAPDDHSRAKFILFSITPVLLEPSRSGFFPTPRGDQFFLSGLAQRNLNVGEGVGKLDVGENVANFDIGHEQPALVTPQPLDLGA